MLLTFEQTAERLGVTRATLYRIVDRYKELPVAFEHYHGKRRRRYFREQDVNDLAKKRNPQQVDPTTLELRMPILIAS